MTSYVIDYHHQCVDFHSVHEAQPTFIMCDVRVRVAVYQNIVLFNISSARFRSLSGECNVAGSTGFESSHSPSAISIYQNEIAVKYTTILCC